MRLICVQPANLYYAWQVEVMIRNFLEKGLTDIHILCAGEHWSFAKLKNNYPVNFYFYPPGGRRNYASSIRPHVLKQHFRKYPEHGECFFYHDCDIIFRELPDFDALEKGDINYGSDCDSYIGDGYIKSKGHGVYEKMQEIISCKTDKGMGAQYVLKNISWEFWDKVERDCETLFTEITELSRMVKQVNPQYHELQIWCADMWALLWNLWAEGRETEISDELSFCFATDSEDQYLKKKILHNAGVTNDKHFFLKSNYINQLPPKNLAVKERTASWYYYQEVVRKSIFTKN